MKLKDKIIKNRVGILIFIGVLLVVTIIIGISYAYFFNIEIKNNNTISGNINTKYYTFESSGNSTLSLTINQSDLDMANASNDYSSFVSGNGGNINVSLNTNGLKKVYCSYDLVYEPVSAYTPSSGAVSAGLKEFTLSGTSDKGNSFSEIDVSGSSTVTLISGIKISTDTNILEKWSFTAKYYNLDVIQDNVAGKTFKGNIKVSNTNCSFNKPARIGYEAILLDNSSGATTVDAAKAYIEGRTTSTTPNFASTATTNEGMYATEDDYTASTGMKSYYFRGAVDNNWVKFGKDSTGKDIYWRIIRINGDGSIRMIYTGTTAPTESTKAVMTGPQTQVASSVFNESSEAFTYISYNSSSVKSILENWYKTTTLETDSTTKALVSQDQIFCSDKSATTSSSETPKETNFGYNSQYYFGDYVRLEENKKPVLTCLLENNKLTSKNSSIGNKTLDYPVGLITADEVAMAGGVYGSNNSSYYLYTGQSYWSGSPKFAFQAASGGWPTSFNASIYEVNSTGKVSDFMINQGESYSSNVRPVVSLSSKAKLSGNGTYDDVYTVVE